ncbi:MAG: hypothetical protein PVH68_13790 [Armatimonadota bacterium]
MEQGRKAGWDLFDPADADGRLWALTHDALLTANREGKDEPIKDWSWHTGIMSYGDGDDWVGMHFWQLMTRPIRLGEGDKYGAPAAIATDASGAIRTLTADGHILRLPDFPDVTAGRVWKTWMEFAVAAPAPPRLLALGRPYALGCTGDRVVVARARDNARPILLVGTVPGEDWTIKAMGTRPTEIHDLLLASDGRALVATCSGLVETRLE